MRRLIAPFSHGGIVLPAAFVAVLLLSLASAAVPLLVSVSYVKSPSDASRSILAPEIDMEFDANIQLGTGSIRFEAAGGQVAYTIDVTSPTAEQFQVPPPTGAVLKIRVAAPLQAFTTYTLVLDGNLVVDAAATADAYVNNPSGELTFDTAGPPSVFGFDFSPADVREFVEGREYSVTVQGSDLNATTDRLIVQDADRECGDASASLVTGMTPGSVADFASIGWVDVSTPLQNLTGQNEYQVFNTSSPLSFTALHLSDRRVRACVCSRHVVSRCDVSIRQYTVEVLQGNGLITLRGIPTVTAPLSRTLMSGEIHSATMRTDLWSSSVFNLTMLAQMRIMPSSVNCGDPDSHLQRPDLVNRPRPLMYPSYLEHDSVANVTSIVWEDVAVQGYGSFRVCICPNNLDGCNEGQDFTTQVADITLEGPALGAAEWRCVLGLICRVQITGNPPSALNGTRLVTRPIEEACGDTERESMRHRGFPDDGLSAPSEGGSGGLFLVDSRPLSQSVVTGQYRLCWCGNTQCHASNIILPDLYSVDVGNLTIDGVPSQGVVLCWLGITASGVGSSAYDVDAVDKCWLHVGGRGLQVEDRLKLADLSDECASPSTPAGLPAGEAFQTPLAVAVNATTGTATAAFDIDIGDLPLLAFRSTPDIGFVYTQPGYSLGSMDGWPQALTLEDAKNVTKAVYAATLTSTSTIEPRGCAAACLRRFWCRSFDLYAAGAASRRCVLYSLDMAQLVSTSNATLTFSPPGPPETVTHYDIISRSQAITGFKYTQTIGNLILSVYDRSPVNQWDCGVDSVDGCDLTVTGGAVEISAMLNTKFGDPDLGCGPSSVLTDPSLFFDRPTPSVVNPLGHEVLLVGSAIGLSVLDVDYGMPTKPGRFLICAPYGSTDDPALPDYREVGLISLVGANSSALFVHPAGPAPLLLSIIGVGFTETYRLSALPPDPPTTIPSTADEIAECGSAQWAAAGSLAGKVAEANVSADGRNATFGFGVVTSPGIYQLCLCDEDDCDDPSSFTHPAGLLVVQGAREHGNYTCAIDSNCTVAIEGWHLNQSDSLAIFEADANATSQCGDPDLQPSTVLSPSNIDQPSPSPHPLDTSRAIFDMGEISDSGSYLLCYCTHAASGCDASSESHIISAGRLSVAQPQGSRQWWVEAGQNMTIGVEGAYLSNQDRLAILEDSAGCGKSAYSPMVAASQPLSPSTGFNLYTNDSLLLFPIPAFVTTGRGLVCWGHMSGAWVPVGYVHVESEGGAVCGDGITMCPDEECDDGRNDGGERCSAFCKIEDSWEVLPTTWTSEVNAEALMALGGDALYSVGLGYHMRPVCGDGTCVRSEQCDDGNTVDGDGCSARCHIETGYLCGSTGGVSRCASLCGDAVVAARETCDDGNRFSHDGCSATCDTEPNWSCSPHAPLSEDRIPVPAVCVPNCSSVGANDTAVICPATPPPPPAATLAWYSCDGDASDGPSVVAASGCADLDAPHLCVPVLDPAPVAAEWDAAYRLFTVTFDKLLQLPSSANAADMGTCPLDLTNTAAVCVWRDQVTAEVLGGPKMQHFFPLMVGDNNTPVTPPVSDSFVPLDLQVDFPPLVGCNNRVWFTLRNVSAPAWPWAHIHWTALHFTAVTEDGGHLAISHAMMYVQLLRVQTVLNAFVGKTGVSLATTDLMPLFFGLDEINRTSSIVYAFRVEVSVAVSGEKGSTDFEVTLLPRTEVFESSGINLRVELMPSQQYHHLDPAEEAWWMNSVPFPCLTTTDTRVAMPNDTQWTAHRYQVLLGGEVSLTPVNLTFPASPLLQQHIAIPPASLPPGLYMYINVSVTQRFYRVPKRKEVDPVLPVVSPPADRGRDKPIYDINATTTEEPPEDENAMTTTGAPDEEGRQLQTVEAVTGGAGGEASSLLWGLGDLVEEDEALTDEPILGRAEVTFTVRIVENGLKNRVEIGAPMHIGPECPLVVHIATQHPIPQSAVHNDTRLVVSCRFLPLTRLPFLVSDDPPWPQPAPENLFISLQIYAQNCTDMLTRADETNTDPVEETWWKIDKPPAGWIEVKASIEMASLAHAHPVIDPSTAYTFVNDSGLSSNAFLLPPRPLAKAPVNASAPADLPSSLHVDVPTVSHIVVNDTDDEPPLVEPQQDGSFSAVQGQPCHRTRLREPQCTIVDPLAETEIGLAVPTDESLACPLVSSAAPRVLLTAPLDPSFGRDVSLTPSQESRKGIDSYAVEFRQSDLTSRWEMPYRLRLHEGHSIGEMVPNLPPVNGRIDVTLTDGPAYSFLSVFEITHTGWIDPEMPNDIGSPLSFSFYTCILSTSPDFVTVARQLPLHHTEYVSSPTILARLPAGSVTDRPTDRSWVMVWGRARDVFGAVSEAAVLEAINVGLTTGERGMNATDRAMRDLRVVSDMSHTGQLLAGVTATVRATTSGDIPYSPRMVNDTLQTLRTIQARVGCAPVDWSRAQTAQVTELLSHDLFQATAATHAASLILDILRHTVHCTSFADIPLSFVDMLGEALGGMADLAARLTYPGEPPVDEENPYEQTPADPEAAAILASVLSVQRIFANKSLELLTPDGPPMTLLANPLVTMRVQMSSVRTMTDPLANDTDLQSLPMAYRRVPARPPCTLSTVPWMGGSLLMTLSTHDSPSSCSHGLVLPRYELYEAFRESSSVTLDNETVGNVSLVAERWRDDPGGGGVSSSPSVRMLRDNASGYMPETDLPTTSRLSELVFLTAHLPSGAPLPVTDMSLPLLVWLPTSKPVSQGLMDSRQSVACRSREGADDEWSERGCRAVQVRSDGVTCACTRLAQHAAFPPSQLHPRKAAPVMALEPDEVKLQTPWVPAFVIFMLLVLLIALAVLARRRDLSAYPYLGDLSLIFIKTHLERTPLIGRLSRERMRAKPTGTISGRVWGEDYQAEGVLTGRRARKRKSAREQFSSAIEAEAKDLLMGIVKETEAFEQDAGVWFGWCRLSAVIDALPILQNPALQRRFTCRRLGILLSPTDPVGWLDLPEMLDEASHVVEQNRKFLLPVYSPPNGLLPVQTLLLVFFRVLAEHVEDEIWEDLIPPMESQLWGLTFAEVRRRVVMQVFHRRLDQASQVIQKYWTARKHQKVDEERRRPIVSLLAGDLPSPSLRFADLSRAPPSRPPEVEHEAELAMLRQAVMAPEPPPPPPRPGEFLPSAMLPAFAGEEPFGDEEEEEVSELSEQPPEHPLITFRTSEVGELDLMEEGSEGAAGVFAEPSALDVKGTGKKSPTRRREVVSEEEGVDRLMRDTMLVLREARKAAGYRQRRVSIGIAPEQPRTEDEYFGGIKTDVFEAMLEAPLRPESEEGGEEETSEEATAHTAEESEVSEQDKWRLAAYQESTRVIAPREAAWMGQRYPVVIEVQLSTDPRLAGEATPSPSMRRGMVLQPRRDEKMSEAEEEAEMPPPVAPEDLTPFLFSVQADQKGLDFRLSAVDNDDGAGAPTTVLRSTRSRHDVEMEVSAQKDRDTQRPRGPSRATGVTR
ncbi:unnamed protein product [Vitrella brassicaformis CCMP3155]|uniref:GPS domain-containing protein n=1 Tax=Vitrella brassicaformis (strain CCMP3155) TaxID=1169540 RepID=A0A0G4EHA3_VITBC|nr:unnamed protein product [Vitrella brassicaformis CCMP3155]|eukprot:CEL95871.1 unnamed protein product [Vitrella brassicaformis CCMP3155]